MVELDFLDSEGQAAVVDGVGYSHDCYYPIEPKVYSIYHSIYEHKENY